MYAQGKQFNSIREDHILIFPDYNPSISRVDQQAIQYWFLQSMFNVWKHSEMFAPVDKAKPETLWHQYRPFHVLCDFFQRNGFGGIIYRSTVYQKGICLALFDISTAICDERTITQYDAAKYC